MQTRMTPSADLTPVDKKDRVYSLGILRGFVLLGILLKNIVDFGIWGAYGDPTVAGGSDGVNLRVTTKTHPDLAKMASHRWWPSLLITTHAVKRRDQ